MFAELAAKSVGFLIRNDIVKKDDEDIYIYGFHLLYINIIDILSIILISCWLNQVFETILYHLSFVTLRYLAGGYHAKTHMRCFIVSTSMWLLSMYAIHHTTNLLFTISFGLISVILIWLKSPRVHIHNPMSQLKKHKMKWRSRIASILLLVIIIIITCIPDHDLFWVTASLVYGMTSHSLLFIISLMENKMNA